MKHMVCYLLWTNHCFIRASHAAAKRWAIMHAASAGCQSTTELFPHSVAEKRAQPRTTRPIDKQRSTQTSLKPKKRLQWRQCLIKDIDNGFADIWFGANGMGELLITPLTSPHHF